MVQETREQKAMRLLRGVVAKNHELEAEIATLKVQQANSAEVESLRAENSRIPGLQRGNQDARTLVDTTRALVRERLGALNLEERLKEKDAELLKLKQQLEDLSRGVEPHTPDPDVKEDRVAQQLAVLGRLETKGEGRRSRPKGGSDGEPQAT